MPGKATTTFSYRAALTVGLAAMAAVVSASSQGAQARVTGSWFRRTSWRAGA